MIYFTSDLHFGHDKEFLYKPRGFENIETHDETLINNWNNLVTDEDEVYILGDIMLRDNEHGKECLLRLNGTKHIIYGNHDTDNRKEVYASLGIDCKYADVIKYGKQLFYLSHYPTITGNAEKDLKSCVINLYGHTHQKTNFFNDLPYMYHVGVDSHNNTPVLIDDIIKECFEKEKECLENCLNF